MCLAILSFQEHDSWPLFLAANRDEAYARPSAPPAIEQLPDLTLLAPRDLEAHGTWLGTNSAGLLAVITNRSDLPEHRQPDTPSRGLLVREVLLRSTIDEALAVVTDERWQRALPYNLLIATTTSLHLVEHVEGTIETRPLTPGLHVVSNLGRMTDAVAQLDRARSLWHSTDGDPWQRAPEILRHGSPDAPICRRGDDRGTVSASVVGIAPSGVVRFLHAGGAPDRAPFDLVHDDVLT